MMKVGAHVSTSGGILNAVSNAEKIKANCLQIFSSPPQQWQGPKGFHDCEEFKDKVALKKLFPVFIHSTYLINLFSENPENVSKSIVALHEDLMFGEKIGAKGAVFHMGSHKDGLTKENLYKVTDALRKIDGMSKNNVEIILENAAGSGSKIGGKIEELFQIKQSSGLSRVKYCLDTAHAFAAGYDLSTINGVENFMLQVDNILGWDEVSFIHLNDSKKELGSKVDRHENIGVGKIGELGLKTFCQKMYNLDIPLILETPGFENNGPDEKNIALVREYIEN